MAPTPVQRMEKTMNRFRTTTVTTPEHAGNPRLLSELLDVEIEKAISKIEAQDRRITGISIASHSGSYILGLIATISHVPNEPA